MLVPDMAGPDGERVKLLDFGVAKLGADPGGRGDGVRTRTGQILGTAAYMAPEQFSGDSTIDGQCDVYALGVVMFRLLTGRLPFMSDDGEVALATMHLFKKPPLLREISIDTSPWMEELVDSMLAKDPTKRPTMEAVVERLQGNLPFRSSLNLPAVVIANRSGERRKAGESSTEIAPTTDHLPPSSPGMSDKAERKVETQQPATITRASGEAQVITKTAVTGGPRRRYGAPMAAAMTIIILAVGGALMVRSRTTGFGHSAIPPLPPVAVTTSAPPAAAPAPVATQPTAQSPAPPTIADKSAATPIAPANPTAPATKSDATAEVADADTDSEKGKGKRRSHRKSAQGQSTAVDSGRDTSDDEAGRSDRSARGSKKAGSKKDGKPRGAGKEAPPIILIN